MKTRNASLIVALILSDLSMCQGQSSSAKDLGQASTGVYFRSSGLTPLRAVIEMSMAGRIPLGIVLGSKPLLCSEKLSFDIEGGTIENALSKLIQGTGYTLGSQGQMYMLMAPDATPHELNQLDYRFDKFSYFGYTLGGAGAMLDGYIATIIEGEGGFALDTLSAVSAKKLDIQMEAPTTRDVANHIVSLGGKGLWLFRPIPEGVQKTGYVAPLRVYGYEDDSAALRSVTCSSDTN